MNPYLFPFLRPEAKEKLNDLYKVVVATMTGIHDGSKKESDLISLARSYKHGKQGSRIKRMLSNPDNYVTVDRSYNLQYAFTMMLWLATYYDFYLKKKESLVMFNIVGSPEMSEYFHAEGCSRLIQCFLQPSQMQCRESPKPLIEQLEDPIYQLFVLDNQFDIDLRHSLANLMAVILGSPPQSNHLWFHMFEADELQNSYMTGFMYDATISPDGLLYDCGVMLSPDGQFGRQDYKKHGCRGTYTLHSLYLLLWANFGCFCMSLLTQPDSDQRIHGKIISKHLPLRDYCVSQLKTLWKHIRDNLGLSEEQRTFFVMNILNRCLQCHPPSPSSSTSPPSMLGSKGKFKTREELDAYEKLWHNDIYQPVWDEQVTEFLKFSKQHQNKFFHDIRNLEMVYPHFVLENELTHYILSSGDLQQHSEGGKLRFLATFTMEQSQLYVGEVLLPDLVELYLWLNKEIAHLLTYKHASSIKIGEVINLAEKSLSKDQGSHIKTLYERVKLSYNQYMKLTGGAIGATPSVTTQQNTISDDTPLLYFLTDVEEKGKNDKLYMMIADIISNHNRIIENFYKADKQTSSFARFLPKEPPKILPTEADSRSAIISGSISYLQLIRSRHQVPTFQMKQLDEDAVSTFKSYVKPMRSRYQMPTFQLEKLEEDFVSTFIAGKPIIKSQVHFRRIFKFKKDLMYTIHDLQDLSEQLPEAFTTDPPDHLTKYFEYEFHSANYHLLVEVLTALKTVTGHLVKALERLGKDKEKLVKELEKEGPGTDKEKLQKELEKLENELENLKQETVPSFLSSLYGDSSETNVLHSIGIQGASPSHLRCLTNLPLTATYSCLSLFFNWVNEGFYDFSTLPFHLKAHLDPKDQQEIEELCIKWYNTTSDLKRGLQQLVGVLKHSEQDIISRINEADSPVVDYLRENHTDMLQENKNLRILIDNNIPRSIMLHHYVEFRLSLRRLQLKVLDDSTEVKDEKKWQEFVGDLWNRHLPHLREELRGEGIYVFIENFCNYGFHAEGEGDSEPNMAALFSELAMEGGKRDDTLQPKVDAVEVGATGRREASILGDLEEKMKTDPELKNKVLSLFQTTGEDTSYDRETLASQLNADYIAEFLIKIGLPQYAETFKVNDVSGEVLLSIVANQEVLEELGVTSPSDQWKIMQQFHKELHIIFEQTISKEDKSSCKLTADAVAEFLIKIELPQYTEIFKASNISGEVLLEASPADLAKLGVTSSLHQMIIMQLFRREVQGTEAKYPKQHLSQFLRQHKLDKYVAILEDAQIDGDMVLEVEEKLMESALKEVGVSSLLHIKKIRSKYKTFTT